MKKCSDKRQRKKKEGIANAKRKKKIKRKVWIVCI